MKSGSQRKIFKHFLALSTATLVCAIVVPARAQLQVTEFMYDTLATNDSIYEWVEVRNTGATDIDLNGAYMDDLLGAPIPNPGSPSIDTSFSAQTVVPAGGVAVIYDAFLATGSPANYNDTLFRNSWGLAPSVPVIAADFFPNLNNTSGGTSDIDGIGIWANRAAYDMDVDTVANVVTSYNHALVGQNYQTVSPWPTPSSGHSIQWKGTGDINNGANWALSQDGVNGAKTNAQISIAGSNLNSTSDIGNPGIVPGGTPPSKLNITEIMYNPRSPEPGWEWVEVYNKTGATIDFGSTPYVLDDISGANLSAANITSGSIPNNGVAVLFDTTSTGVTVQNMKDAWGNSINFIPVTNFPALNNTAASMTDGGGDTFGIWNSLSSYTGETVTGTTRTFNNAVESIDYDINANGWPNADGNGSIYLTDLGADPSVGSNWLLSALGDGLSYNPNQLTGSTIVHPGGDVGSPGDFTAASAGLDGDFNNDGSVDAADYVIWRKGGSPNPNDPADYNLWRTHFGETTGSGASLANSQAVPEPASLGLVLLALASLWSVRPRA